MDPGRYHAASQRDDETQLKTETTNYSINQINLDVMLCSTCFIVKPPRTHHCRYCGACIDVSFAFFHKEKSFIFKNKLKLFRRWIIIVQ